MLRSQRRELVLTDYAGGNNVAIGKTFRDLVIFKGKKQRKSPAWMENSKAEERKVPNKGREDIRHINIKSHGASRIITTKPLK